MTDIDELKRIIMDLQNNPMFACSLASRELFHSNIWAWLIRKYPKTFTYLFIDEYNQQDEIVAIREYEKMDLFLEIGNNKIIIENKFKSMPNKAQLDDYWKKIEGNNKKLILVSYFDSFFEMEENWIKYSYEDIKTRLKSCFENRKENIVEEDKNFITAYINLLSLLIELKKCIKINDTDTVEDFYIILYDDKIQKELDKINFSKTLERIYVSELTNKVLNNFKYKELIDSICINCGRDHIIYSDIVFFFENHMHEDEDLRNPLGFLGISLWGENYRYYTCVNKKKCNITTDNASNNKNNGYEYLQKNYSKIFTEGEGKKYGGYHYQKEMYLYQKENICTMTIKDLKQKVQKDLKTIYEQYIDTNK